MGDEEARALVQRWWDGVWRAGNLDMVHELCTDPYTRHTGTGSETVTLAEYKKKLAQTQRVLRHATTTIDDEVIAGDKVWSRATSRGVNLEGDNANVLTWMVIHRIEDGKLAEVWALTQPGVDWEQP